jgi:O-methyltransferase
MRQDPRSHATKEGSMSATLEQIAQSALSSVETLRASYDIARMAIERGVLGDLVECGVYAGAQAAAMALAIMQGPLYVPSLSIRRVHLFDSFTGIPAGGPNDTEWLAAGHQPGHSTCSLAQVKTNMRSWGIDESLLVYHPGMFSDTMTLERTPNWCGESQVRKIAVLRLDGDLYESTKTAMTYLYPLLSQGGWVIVDDFALSGCRKAIYEFVNPGPVYFIRP